MQAAGQIGFPLVPKVLSPRIVHQSDVGWIDFPEGGVAVDGRITVG